MKKYAVILLLSLSLLGCGQCGLSGPKQKGAVLARVNDYEITTDEFEREFKDSYYSVVDTPQARKDFLDNLINRKLMLQDAQALGLDKDEAFLKVIERFWEQSLLKVYLDQKAGEIAAKAAKEGLSREKQAELLNEWVAELRKGADIKVDQEAFHG